MKLIRRGFLYLNSLIFFAFGLTAIVAPHIINQAVHLVPSSIAGTGETRGLYGGGFIGFGVVILLGLRCPSLARGLLLAMGLIMGGVVVGRLVSIVIDHEFATTVQIIVGELLLALACWLESKSELESPQSNSALTQR